MIELVTNFIRNILIIVLISCGGCSPEVVHIISTDIVRSDYGPAFDADRDYRGGKRALMAINEITTYCPGIGESYDILSNRYQIRIIDDTSDQISRKDNKKDGNFVEYVALYNKQMITLLRSN